MCQPTARASRSDLEPRKGEGGGEGGEKVAKTESATFPNKQDVLSSLLLLESTTWEKVAAGTPRGDIINTKIIGNWLTSVCVRIHNGMRIELVKGSRAHGNKYTLITVADPQKG